MTVRDGYLKKIWNNLRLELYSIIINPNTLRVWRQRVTDRDGCLKKLWNKLRSELYSVIINPNTLKVWRECDRDECLKLWNKMRSETHSIIINPNTFRVWIQSVTEMGVWKNFGKRWGLNIGMFFSQSQKFLSRTSRDSPVYILLSSSQTHPISLVQEQSCLGLQEEQV